MNRTRYTTLAEINVTSLVDVSLVLLIIFMITAPLLQSGLEVNLPRADADELQAKEGIVVVI
ncbi:MAG: biopolymer transporter ExbD, partial [Calditrichaeota bacterium]|nr:biopolymer transporter ExbD [Calditrichota bacterium]